MPATMLSRELPGSVIPAPLFARPWITFFCAVKERRRRARRRPKARANSHRSRKSRSVLDYANLQALWKNESLNPSITEAGYDVVARAL